MLLSIQQVHHSDSNQDVKRQEERSYDEKNNDEGGQPWDPLGKPRAIGLGVAVGHEALFWKLYRFTVKPVRYSK